MNQVACVGVDLLEEPQQFTRRVTGKLNQSWRLRAFAIATFRRVALPEELHRARPKRLRFVLLESIGRATLRGDVAPSVVLDSIAAAMQ